MQNTPAGRRFSKRWRDCEMDAVGEEFGQVVKHQRGFVGDNRLGEVLLIAAPECKADQIVMFIRGNGR